MPLLLLSIGNTNTSVALCRNGTLAGAVATFETVAFGAGAAPPLLRDHPDLPCFAACVVPEAGRRLAEGRGPPVGFIQAADVATPDFGAVDTSTLGQDRIANAVGALTVHSPPVIVMDCGTAVTTEVVDAEGRFRGGVIAPGRATLAAALHNDTAQLPAVALAGSVGPALNGTTREAIQSGVNLGALGMARHVLGHTRNELGCPECPVLITGGDSAFFVQNLHVAGVLAAPEHLTLRGLAVAAASVMPESMD